MAMWVNRRIVRTGRAASASGDIWWLLSDRNKREAYLEDARVRSLCVNLLH